MAQDRSTVRRCGFILLSCSRLNVVTRKCTHRKTTGNYILISSTSVLTRMPAIAKGTRFPKYVVSFQLIVIACIRTKQVIRRSMLDIPRGCCHLTLTKSATIIVDLLRPQPTQANLETSWKPGLRTSCELISN